MWIRRREEEAQSLHSEALARLAEGDLEGAEALGGRLEAMGWAGAFEVLALVRRKRGDLAGAIAVLDEGTALAPETWSLHVLRGNLLDEAGRRDEALEAFDAALRCPGAWVSSVRFNRAITRLRAGDPGGALEDAEHVITDGASPPFTGEALKVAVDALVRLGRTEDAVAIVEHVLSAIDASEAPEIASAIQATRARALHAAGRVEAEVRAACALAIEGASGNVEVAEVLRALAPDDGRGKRRHRVVLEVSTDAASGYFRVLSVIAADEAEARELASTLEPAALRARARVHELTDEAEASGPSHVTPLSGRIPFEE